jgi:hypothetical protein
MYLNFNKGGKKKLMGQITLITSLVLIGLFTIAMIGFALNFASDTSADISIADDAELSLLSTQTNTNVGAFTTDANDTYYSIVGSSITSADTTASGSQFALTPINAIGTVKNILEVGWVKIFGTGSGFSIFLTTLLGMLTFMIGLYIWKTWKGGSPD